MTDVLALLALEPPGWGGNLLRGLVASLQIALGAYSLGLVIGVAGAMGKLHGSETTRALLDLYTTIVRAVPELVLILILYFAVNDLINAILLSLDRDTIEINGLVAGIGVLGVVQGAYATEVIRGAIQTIPQGQLEAATAFGMSPWQKLRRITLPAMLPYAIPGLGNLWLNATKDTSILAIVGFAELTLETRQAAGSTKAYFLFYTIAGLIYLVVTLASTWGIRRIEKRVRRGLPSGA